MKIKICLCVIGILLLIGCGTSDQIERYAEVEKMFPEAEIINDRISYNDFIVREKNGTIWYVQTSVFSSSIKSKFLIFPACK